MTTALSDLVRCETYRAHFPAGLPWRGCLRRQLEAKRVGKGWEPARPFCSSTCELGREVAAAARAAGVALGTCSGCGAALVGVETCEPCTATGRALYGPKVIGEPCAGCGSVSSHKAGCPRPPRLRTRARRARRAAAAPVKLLGAPVSTRIWGPDAPDAPIAPPPRQDVGLTAEQVAEATERVRVAAGKPTRVATPPRPPPSYRIDPQPRGAPDAEPPASQAEEPPMRAARPASFEVGEPATQPEPQHQPPAQPAHEETTMPRGGAHEPCKECKSTTRHKNGCSKPGRAAAGKKRATAPSPAKKAAPAPRKLRTLADVAARRPVGGTIPELVAEKAHHVAKVKAIDEELRRQKALLDKALGEAA